MKPEHENKQCALRNPLLNVGQASHRPDKVHLLLKDSIFPQLIRGRLENPHLLTEAHPPLILVMDKQALYMPALPSSGQFAELFKVNYLLRKSCASNGRTSHPTSMMVQHQCA